MFSGWTMLGGSSGGTGWTSPGTPTPAGYSPGSGWSTGIQAPVSQPVSASVTSPAVYGTVYGGSYPATQSLPGRLPGVAATIAFGEGGAYVDLDYPEMRFLKAGENPTELLSEIRAQRTGARPLASWAALALILLAAVKS